MNTKIKKITNTINQVKNEPEKDIELELRLKRSLQLCSQLEQELKLAQAKHQSSLQMQHYLLQEHQTLKKSFIFARTQHFDTNPSKIRNLLANASISNVGGMLKDQSKKQEQHLKSGQCNQSHHLKIIFDTKQKEKQSVEITILQQKRDQLYKKIQQSLQQQMLNEKVLGRIIKQSRRVANKKLVQYLEKQIKTYNSWLQQTNDRTVSELANKEMESKIVSNLEKMKLLMNKKVLNNDYIYNHFGEDANQIKIVDGFDRYGRLFQQKTTEYCKKLNEAYTQSLFKRKNEKINVKQAKNCSKKVQFSMDNVKNYFQSAQKLIDQIQNLDIDSKLIEKYQQVNYRSEQLIKSLKK